MTEQVAIVTGACNGIGWATARRLHADGFQVVLADRDPGLTAKAAEAGMEDASVVVGSVTDPVVVDQIFAAVAARSAPLAVLVNNAGVGGPSGHVSELGSAAVQGVLDVNLIAPFELATRAGVLMMREGYGRIINLGSVFGQQAVPETAAYCIAKGAITQLTQSLAVDFGPHNITANTVAPGYILTDMHREAIRSRAVAWGVGVEEAQRRLADSVPLRRHGTGEDVAAVIAWLAGPDSAYVTGQTIAVNGGTLLS